MTDELRTAFLLMGIGMITVFMVLFCVVIVGKLLISYVNRFLPQVETTTQSTTSNTNIEPTKLAVIASAIEIFTKGKGKITRINKID